MRSPSLDPYRDILPAPKFVATVRVPTSKSRANRMLFLAALDPRPIRLEGVPESSDVTDMLRCLEIIGLKIDRSQDGVVVIHNSFPACENTTTSLEIPCGYGGTTTRFLAALLSLGKRRYILEPQGHMRQRPMSEIIAPLHALGVQAHMETSEGWLVIQGPVKNQLSELEVNASRSTQFASALAMGVSVWGGKVVPQGMHASEDYFAMTLDCIEASKKKSTWVVPADFSSLSYPLALAAVSGEVLVTNVHERDHLQPDSIFIDILQQMGAQVEWSAQGLRIKKHKLRAWSGDCEAFPDLVPTLAFVCAFAEGTSCLSNLGVLRHKECDRYAEVFKILQLFERSISAHDDKFIIEGKSEISLDPKNYLAPDDHRMIMVVALFMRCMRGGTIHNWQHVRKSYPNFFSDLIDVE